VAADEGGAVMGETLRGGLANPNWRGGRSVASNGYVLVRVGVGHPIADVRGYAYEHRLVASMSLGRPLAETEVVHHRDGNKQNNSLENLDVLSHAEHRVEHRKHERGLRMPGECNPSVVCACGCGESMSRFDSSGRPRRYVSGHNESSPAPTRNAILAALANGPMLRAEIVRTTGRPRQAVAVALSKLKRAGAVTSDGHGTWRKVA
jgi:predicted Rossmann fold nucleotide-binding protein DprA/Smf involved in DNA uptake